ncbi:hypothetical protein ADK41_25560 [Streptomyces caelestis]|uniref:Uncharacterized protein n=1 Tax=Streptomyces caelestis TaxID=36816 RepID=A0A0M8QGE3_9ACTN|nr:hypothetical protein ADK41_25560 [Streptomyces caelestis]
MQRLDGQLHPVLLGVGAEFGERVRDAFPGAAQVLGAGRQSARDQDQGVGAEHGRLVDRPPVVGQRRRPLAGVDRGEEAAPAQRRHRQARVAHELGRGLHAVRLDGLAPQAHARYAQLAAGVDEVRQRQLPDRHLVDAEAREVGHGVTPYRCSRVLMRSSASFGSGNRPRPSASS